MGMKRSLVLFTLSVLLGINTMNFYDRQVPAVVAEPLRQELDLSYTRYGWLTPAFLILYAILGVDAGTGIWAVNPVDVNNPCHACL